MSEPISYGDALSWLDRHINIEKNSHAEFPPPSLEKIREVLGAIGQPQTTYHSIHVTGTNGKGSTSRIISSLLMAHGLRVGTYSSPHLAKINERIMVDLQPIDDSDLLNELYTLKLLEEHSGKMLSWFELMTAAAFSHFDTVGVDVAVIEVGMGGTWDATNVIDGDVSVITNVSLDHVDILGPELSDIAREKSGIIKPGSSVIIGVEQEDLLPIFLSRESQGVVALGKEIVIGSNRQAIGGRVLSVITKRAAYDDLFLPLFGPHQAKNAALAIAAVEEFFSRGLDLDVVRAAFERSTSPGRMEVVSRAPLVVLDAAHNPAGMLSAKESILSDFSTVRRWHLVVSMLEGRDPNAMMLAIDNDKIASIIIAPTRSMRAMDTAKIADAVAFLGKTSRISDSVTDGLESAIDDCQPDEGILLCGSIYAVAEARESILKGSLK